MRLDQAPAIAALLLATLSATAIQAADLIRFHTSHVDSEALA